MILVGLLSFYDEQPWYLGECVESLARTVDHLVVVDGAYKRWPDAYSSSPVSQIEAVREAASGVPHTLFVPSRVWESEIAKRSFMFELGRQAEADWLLVVDADERVAGASGRLRRELAATSHDVAEVRFRTVRELVYEERMRRLFRSLPDLTVRGHHGTYVAGGVQLWGNGELAPAFDATGLLTIEHHCGMRTAARERARHAYMGGASVASAA